MPLYEYICPSCQIERTVFKKLADYDGVEFCCTCEVSMQKKLSAPAIIGDYAGYTCPVSGKWIEGRKAHQENLDRTGCRVLETGEAEESAKRRAGDERKLDKAMDNTVDEFITKLPTKKKESLASEMAAGVNAQVVRK